MKPDGPVEDDVNKGGDFLELAIDLARTNIAKGGRPFGAVVVKDGNFVASGVNETYLSNDSTDHAEMAALRAASRVLQSPDLLRGSTVYASGHPCPMCVAAMRLAGVERVVYAFSNEDGAPFGLSNAPLYAEMANPFTDLQVAIEHRPAKHDPDTGIYAEWKRSQPR
ncbi:nucleoside deaminase [Aquamicrobium ahrensii]|uniref:nucleoside deaminase n=1 Tax=Aquamicrobium ahrensii TaxID=469551 RepID=UPI003398BCB5